jgi:hypothetical protein
MSVACLPKKDQGARPDLNSPLAAEFVFWGWTGGMVVLD